MGFFLSENHTKKMTSEGMQSVILPPPLVREIIDKTAGFVVKNGRAFETRITGSAQGATLKFAFLGADHPFHGYYEQKLSKAFSCSISWSVGGT